jgi:hypothetical protein
MLVSVPRRLANLQTGEPIPEKRRPEMGNLLKETPYSEITASLEVLDFHNVTGQHLAWLRSDKDYARQVAEFMLRGGVDGSMHHKLARAVMGQNFFGVEEWATLYGANFSKKRLREVNEFPWGEDILNSPCPFNKGKAVHETHFAFLGLEKLNADPLTILKWQLLHPATGQPKFASYVPDSWYSQQTFAAETAKLRWYLLLASIVPNSTNTAWTDQLAMLPADYEVPTAIEEVSKDILAYRKTGTFLNPGVYARVNNTTSDGYRVVVGRFDGDGLSINRWDDLGIYDVGLAPSRKLPRTLNP